MSFPTGYKSRTRQVGRPLSYPILLSMDVDDTFSDLPLHQIKRKRPKSEPGEPGSPNVVIVNNLRCVVQ